MNAVLPITLAALLLTLNFVPLFILLAALFPGRLAKTREAAQEMPWRAFAIGLINSLFFSSIGMVLFALAERANGIWKVAALFPAVLILVFLAVGLVFGLGSFVEFVGERTLPAQTSWKRTFWGTLLVGASCAFPFFGWFVILPYLGWAGIGAFIISFFRKS